jgi:hypothetical protein
MRSIHAQQSEAPTVCDKMLYIDDELRPLGERMIDAVERISIRQSIKADWKVRKLQHG